MLAGGGGLAVVERTLLLVALAVLGLVAAALVVSHRFRAPPPVPAAGP
jgi:hypothetical protein